MATGRPTAASARAVASPMPEPPPVTTTPVLGVRRCGARSGPAGDWSRCGGDGIDPWWQTRTRRQAWDRLAGAYSTGFTSYIWSRAVRYPGCMEPAAAQADLQPLRPPLSGALVDRQASSEQVAAYIRELIFDGQLRQGARLPQDAIADALGVSRIPIREAIVALEREGWLVTRLHRGAFVNAFDEAAIRDHYEMYGLLYGLAARRALERGGPDVVDQVSTLATQVALASDPREVQALALAFHRAVVDATGSARIRGALRALAKLVPGSFFEQVPEAIGSEQRGLGTVAEAMRRRDADAAAAAYQAMLEEQGEMVVDLFRRRSLVV